MLHWLSLGLSYRPCQTATLPAEAEAASGVVQQIDRGQRPGRAPGRGRATRPRFRQNRGVRDSDLPVSEPSCLLAPTSSLLLVVQYGRGLSSWLT